MSDDGEPSIREIVCVGCESDGEESSGDARVVV